MALDSQEKRAIIEKYQTHEGDTGSPEVQIAILSKRISDLTEHSRVTQRISILAVACTSSLVKEMVS